MTLGQRIQHYRTTLDLSQEGLGEKLGVTRQAVSKWEADGAVPDTDKLIALSKLFGITLNELLQVENPPPSVPPEEDADKKLPQKRTVLLPVLALLAFVLGITAYTISMGTRMGALQDRQAALELRLTELESRLEEPPGLDPSAPLVAGLDFDFNANSILLDLTPYQLPESLDITFTVSRPYSSPIIVQGDPQEGGHYAAVLNVQGLSAPFTVTATFSDGVSQYNQALIRILSLEQHTCSWEPLWDAS